MELSLDTIFYFVCKFKIVTVKSVYGVFITLISIEINFPRVIIAVKAPEVDAWRTQEVQLWDVVSIGFLK